MSRIKGRGSNPKSHNNKPRLGLDYKEIGLKSEDWYLAKQIGGGNASKGVRELFARLPIFYQIKLYLEQQAAQGDEIAESLLWELEGLEIEALKEDAIADGVLKTPSGAYIV